MYRLYLEATSYWLSALTLSFIALQYGGEACQKFWLRCEFRHQAPPNRALTGRKFAVWGESYSTSTSSQAGFPSPQNNVGPYLAVYVGLRTSSLEKFTRLEICRVSENSSLYRGLDRSVHQYKASSVHLR